MRFALRTALELASAAIFLAPFAFLWRI